MSEKHYDFREWMKTYHLRNGRKNGRCINSGEIEITNTWMIYAEDPEDILAERAVADMKVFLRKAMGVTLAPAAEKKICLKVSGDGSQKHSCKYEVSPENITMPSSSFTSGRPDSFEGITAEASLMQIWS